jgi:hypothetical protein
MEMFAPSPRLERAPFHWRGLTFFCVTLALCVSLASRTVDLKLANRPTVASATQKARIQHLDKDAFGWSSPVSAFTLFLAPAPHAEAMVEEPLVLFHHVYTCLYNRPPPLS